VQPAFKVHMQKSERQDRPEFGQVTQNLDASTSIIYVVDSALRFVYCNPAWDRFASENGRPELAGDKVIGSELLPVVPSVLRSFYERVYQQVLRTGLIWQHVYECSSPRDFRKFQMRIHALKADWLLISNVLLVEKPHVHKVPSRRPPYRNAGGLITMCAHCRCSQRTDESKIWDFVPDHLALRTPPLSVTHGICPLCRAYFYPEEQGRDELR